MSYARLVAATIVLIVVATVYFFVLFATGTLDTVTSGRIAQVDLLFAKLFFDLRSAWLIWLFTVVTVFGTWSVVFLLAISASVILGLSRRLRYMPGLWLVLIGNQTLVSVLKGIFLRPRPEYAVYREGTASFPSGHSAASIALFGFLTYVLVRDRIGPRALVFAGGFMMIILVGSSRLVLGEHYLTDVLSGYLVGGVWVGLGMCLTELPSFGRARPSVTERWRRLAVYAVVVCTGIALYFIATSYVASLMVASLEQSNPG